MRIQKLPAARRPETLQASPHAVADFSFQLSEFQLLLSISAFVFQVAMMLVALVQALAPVLPPMARARTA
jgi:hypothetical protein